MAYDPTSGELRDTLRMMIGDTDDNNVIFTDDEYALAISEVGSDKYAAAAFMLYALAASTARVAVMMKTMSETIDRKAVTDKLKAQAVEYLKLSDEDLTVQEVFLENGLGKCFILNFAENHH